MHDCSVCCYVILCMQGEATMQCWEPSLQPSYNEAATDETQFKILEGKAWMAM